MRLTILFGCALLASGCAAQTQAPSGPPSWQAGYSAGCASGYKAAGNPYYQYQKDFGSYGADPLYKQGWDEGYGACKDRYNAIR